eukprot:144654_1
MSPVETETPSTRLIPSKTRLLPSKNVSNDKRQDIVGDSMVTQVVSIPDLSQAIATPHPQTQDSSLISNPLISEETQISILQLESPAAKPPLEQRRSLLLIFSVVTIALSSGLVYGWPTLARSLIKNEHSTLTESQLGLIFTVGSWSTQGGRFFAGLARDWISGTRTTACVCLLATLGGTLGIAFCSENNIAGLAVSMLCIGIGSGAFFCVQPVAGIFPLKRQGSILSTFSGVFQISGSIFLLLIAISADRRKSFGSFAALLGLLLLVAFRMLPKEHFVKWEENKVANTEHLKDNGIEDDASVASTNGTTECNTSMKMANVFDQIRSWEYFLLLLWFSIQVIPLQYYVATIGFQLERKGDDDGTYTSLFSILYASSAIISPLIGRFADSAGLGIAQGVGTILCSISLIFLGLESIPLKAHVFGLCCYDVGRMMVFGMFFTNIGKRFGYKNYGTLAGTGLIVSAIGSLIQYPLISLAARGNDSLVNFVSGSALAGFGLPYCFWLWRREYAEKRMRESMKESES